MERRALMISFVVSFVAMFLVYQYIDGKDKELQEQYGVFVPMVVASRDILQFQTIRPSDLETIRVPKALEPRGLILDVKDVIDAVAAVPITKGEHVLDNKIISKNVYSGLDSQVTVGRRAISIPVNVKTSVGHMMRPGSRVDLATYFEYSEGGSKINEVKVFMQDVLVLATGRMIQSTSPKAVDQSLVRDVAANFPQLKDGSEVREMLNHAKSDTQFGTITLEVTPQQAQVITYVLSVFADNISVMLRHTDDRTLERRSTTKLVDVMGPNSYLARGKKAPPPRAVPRIRFFDLKGTTQMGVE